MHKYGIFLLNSFFQVPPLFFCDTFPLKIFMYKSNYPEKQLNLYQRNLTSDHSLLPSQLRNDQLTTSISDQAATCLIL